MDMKQSMFVLSPPGNGLDCHRTWEAMLLRVIPIVESNELDPLFSDLPVLIVKDLKAVDEELLHATLEQFAHKDFNMEKIFMQYWKQLLKSKKLQIDSE
jgi:hypothetical protein